MKKLSEIYLSDTGDEQIMSPEKYNKKLLAQKYQSIYKIATTDPKTWGK